MFGFLLFLLVGVLVVVLLHSTNWLVDLGAAPEGDLRVRMEQSPRFADGRFRNSQSTALHRPGMLGSTLRRWLVRDPRRTPPGPLPVGTPTLQELAHVPASGLRVTWLGHATALLEVDGYRILTDPVFAERASPSRLLGPRRTHPPPLALTALPRLDAVVISHDHYDHLDAGAIRELAATEVQFFVPLGVGAHLRAWGVERKRVTELDWGEPGWVDDVRLVATEARHFSGRGPFDRDRTLWCAWAILGPTHRVFFGGDSGTFPGLAGLGEEHGPFDLTLLKIGAYDESWPDIHFTPEEAVAACVALQGRLMLPIHWATFQLALHPWDEPIQRCVAAAAERDVELVVPWPGQPVEPAAPPTLVPWWESVGAPAPAAPPSGTTPSS